MKLKYYLYIILLFLTIVPIFFFGYVMIESNSEHVEEIMSENLRVVANSYISDIQNFCASINDTMEVFCELQIVKDIIKEKDWDKYDIMNQEYLENFLES